MATLSELAPTLSQYVSETEAKEIASKIIKQAAPPTPKAVADLDAPTRAQLFKWIRWFGAEKTPAGLPEWVYNSPSQVASLLGMTEAYVLGLIAERDAIVQEVEAWGDNAFAPEHPMRPTITGATVINTNLVIVGENFTSFAPHVTRIQLTRGVTDIIRTQAQIEAGGGSVTVTTITVPLSVIPGGQVLSGDVVLVQADGLTTPAFAIEVP